MSFLVLLAGGAASRKLYLNYMYDNILVDGKNIVCRATMAARSGGFKVHPVTIMIRMMDRWRRTFDPKHWRIFWDVPKETLWRREIYSEYKEGRPEYDKVVHGYIKDSQKIAALVFANMAMTQYIKKCHEADDLVYAFVVGHLDQNNLVVTSDGDATQIPYHLGVDLFNPGNKDGNVEPIPEYDPVVVKSLAGDKSDNIPNYRLIRDLSAYKIIDKGIDEFLDERGRELFDRNKKLVDLSYNPYLDENIEYVKSVKENDSFDIQKIRKLIAKYNIDGLSGDLVTRVRPFKNI